MKVYMGTNVVYNESLNEKITAVEFIYNSTKKPSNYIFSKITLLK